MEPYVYEEQLGCIEVMDNVFIGYGTIVLGGVRIGPNVVVAAGSLVNRDVPPNTVVGGVPAKVLGTFTEFEKKRREYIYPFEIRPYAQKVSKELENYMWNDFQVKHSNV